ncbi:unnamed protein product [Owenia fusiformis]|uniref:Uncharacterized protein n=1 Tax=Owenia fusiformis TaxID=6347 RepID=A0A8J1XES4_OWEFU|nr:unnamed protein product [Owenia fusiformis]
MFLVLVALWLMRLSHGQVAVVVNLTPEEEAACVSGYLPMDTGLPSRDCCRYLQCLGRRKAYERVCAKPLIWNQKTCSCDRKRTRPECIDTPEACYETKQLKECPDPSLLPNNTCCAHGTTYTPLSDGRGYRIEGERTAQGCPEGQTFKLIPCCCEGEVPSGRGDCIHFGFDGNVRDDIQGTFIAQGGLQITTSAKVGTGAAVFNKTRPASIPYFSKFYGGFEATIAAWIRIDEVAGNVWDNADNSSTATFYFTLNPTPAPQQANDRVPGGPGPDSARIGGPPGGQGFPGGPPLDGPSRDVPPGPGLPDFPRNENVEYIIKFGDANDPVVVRVGGGACPGPNCGSPGTGPWHHVAVVLFNDVVTVFVDGLPTGEPIPNKGKPQIGTNRPLTIGRGFRGAIDDFVMCKFAWTNEELQVYVNVDPTIPQH